jgi:hypothetical protein
MKKIIYPVALLLWSISGYAQSKSNNAIFNGDALFANVKKYVSLGIHRTGTTTDHNTSEWLGKELKLYGYDVKYLDFSLKQFFLESAAVKSNNQTINAFPLWYVNDKKLEATGTLVDGRKVKDNESLKNKLVYFKLSGAGQLSQPTIKKLNQFIAAGASGVVAVSENISGEIQASNAQKDQTPWAIPIVLVAPKDSAKVLSGLNKPANISVKGTFKQVTARNVYGKIGNGSKYVVVSTPISGWFTCGGERGPGVATWLALAKWASQAKLPYTFIFTGNSGHELSGIGANAFLEQIAPPASQTQLWVHLGAGIATLQWQQTPNGLKKLDHVDAGRNLFYTPSLKNSFETAFKNVPGHKFQVEGQGLGELVYVAAKGYKNYAGAVYSHPYFHVATDDANTTSPQILNEIALAFKNFIQTDLSAK